MAGANTYKTQARLRKAMEYRGVNDLNGLFREAAKRADDNRLHGLYFDLAKILEPPACTMSHCESHGGVGCFCDCCEDRVPGRCAKYQAFRKRQIEKGKKKTAGALIIKKGCSGDYYAEPANKAAADEFRRVLHHFGYSSPRYHPEENLRVDLPTKQAVKVAEQMGATWNGHDQEGEVAA
ncbi:hypothetical protein [Desulfarculus baarsii]